MMIIVAAGFIFAKICKVEDKEQKFLSKMLLYFINPCVVINSFNLEFNPGKLKQLAFVFFISLCIHGVMILIGTLFTLSKKPFLMDYNHLDRLGVVFTNCGFVGIPLIRGVFGNEGVFYLMGYLIVFNILLWTYGYYQLSGTINLKKIITNPNIIAVALGIIIFCMPFTLPNVIAKPISMIADLNTAVAMILIGILFAEFKLPEIQGMKTSDYIFRVVRFTILRLVVCSIVNLFVLYGIYLLCGNIPDSRMMLFVIFICSMCPAATSVPSLACVFDKDRSYASLIVSITSLLCMISVPSFVALGELFIK